MFQRSTFNWTTNYHSHHQYQVTDPKWRFFYSEQLFKPNSVQSNKTCFSFIHCDLMVLHGCKHKSISEKRANFWILLPIHEWTAQKNNVLPCDGMAVGKNMISRAIVHFVKNTQTPKWGRTDILLSVWGCISIFLARWQTPMRRKTQDSASMLLQPPRN